MQRRKGLTLNSLFFLFFFCFVSLFVCFSASPSRMEFWVHHYKGLHCIGTTCMKLFTLTSQSDIWPLFYKFATLLFPAVLRMSRIACQNIEIARCVGMIGRFGFHHRNTEEKEGNNSHSASPRNVSIQVGQPQENIKISGIVCACNLLVKWICRRPVEPLEWKWELKS